MGIFTSRMAQQGSNEKSPASKESPPVASESPMARAKGLVAKNPVVVFSKSYCPYCIRVKNLLSGLDVKMTVLELDYEGDGDEIQAALHEWTGQRTVPNVFIGGKHIGGCDDTTALHKQGKLVPLLKEANAIPSATTAA